jgi:hypothetical protein
MFWKMSTLKKVIDTRDQNARVCTASANKLACVGRSSSMGVRNACGQKKNATCGNATRW